MPRSARNVASLAGVSPSHDSARMRAPGCRWRTMPSSARPCRLTSATSCSDQPSRAAARLKADALGRQSVSLGGNGAQQQVADAVVERIAAGQHDDRPAAMLLDLRQGVADRARPGERAAADQRLGQAEVALAADHQLGRRHQLLRHRRQAFDAVLADADDGQPARGPCSLRRQSMRVLILGGTTEASALAKLLAGDPRFEATLSFAGRTAAPKPQPIATRIGGFGGADGLARLPARAGDRGGDRRHPSLCPAHLRQRRRRLRARRRAAGLVRPSRLEA